MPITTADLEFRLSGGASNAVGNDSLGGIISSNAVAATLHGLFDRVTGAEAAAGDVEYRCIYVRNNHATLTLYDAKVWIASNTPSANTAVAIGLGSAPINNTEQTVADEVTAPSGVSFTAPTTYAGGLLIGDLQAGQSKAVWIRRTVDAAAAAYTADSFQIGFQGETGS